MSDSINERLAAVRARIDEEAERVGRDPDEVSLVAVSKRQPLDLVRAAHAAGQRAFGENRVQDFVERAGDLDDLGLEWHFIGSVQSNKVRALCEVPGLAMLHSVDRPKLCDKIAQVRQEIGCDQPLSCLLQVDATDDANKHGVRPEELDALFDHAEGFREVLRVDGLMAMGPLVGESAPVFEAVRRLRDGLEQRSGRRLPHLSMGMSGDLSAAIGAGSTIVRVGTAVFGPRTT
ncbi:MAG: YggS family pyridoxal phosphate-dependent enzyme [Planctomycetota bacterium]